MGTIGTLRTKMCNRCNRSLPFECFYANKAGKFGLHSLCKECNRAQAVETYDSDKQSERYFKRLDKIKEYRQSEHYKSLHAEHSRHYRKLHPEKVNAHASAYRLGLEPESCNICGGKGTEKHHPDYSKPKEIIWLCHTCHSKLSRRY